jgi:organic hydroperoxide reductase OsmC/OhrA
MPHVHHYRAALKWTGAAQGPTSSYGAYSRDYTFAAGDKPPLQGSADATFRGDAAKYNPEDLLVMSLSACHLLTYLALCARGSIQVIAYEDRAEGQMEMKDGHIRFTGVTLRPRVVIAPGSDLARARALHEKAHEECFIANSVNFPVLHEAEVVLAE